MVSRFPMLLGCVCKANLNAAEPEKESDEATGQAQIRRSTASMEEKKGTVLEHLVDEHIAHGGPDALKKFVGVLDAGFKAIGSDMPYHRCPLAFRMIFKQCKDQQRHKVPDGLGDCCQKDQAFYQRALRCLNLAGAAYSPSDKTAIALAVQGLSKDHVRYVHEGNAVHSPSWFLASDPVLDAIVLSIRGTTTLADVFTDVLITPSEFLGMRAHSGVLRSAINVVDAAKPELERMMAANPDRKIVLVGHSLGAATAILAALDFLGEDSEHYDYMLTGKVECWAFGPPPALSHPEELPDCVKNSIYTFVHNFDIVPRACPVAICKLLLALDYVNRKKFWRVQRWYGKVSRSNHLPDSVELEADQVQQVEALLGRYKHTGHLRLLRHVEDAQSGRSARSDELSDSVTDRCFVHPRMAQDHLVSSYESVLKGLAGCQQKSFAMTVPHLQRQGAHFWRAGTI